MKGIQMGNEPDEHSCLDDKKVKAARRLLKKTLREWADARPALSGSVILCGNDFAQRIEAVLTKLNKERVQ